MRREIDPYSGERLWTPTRYFGFSGGGGSGAGGNAVGLALPSFTFNATNAIPQSINHKVQVNCPVVGCALFYASMAFSVIGAGSGGFSTIALFVDNVKILGSGDNSILTDAELEIAGTSNIMYAFTESVGGSVSLPAPYTSGSGITRHIGQRGITVSPGMTSTNPTTPLGQVLLGSPIMLNLGAGVHSIDLRYAPLAPNPPTVQIPSGGIMWALGF
jgi:hypothetical protein